MLSRIHVFNGRNTIKDWGPADTGLGRRQQPQGGRALRSGRQCLGAKSNRVELAGEALQRFAGALLLFAVW